MTKFTYPNDYCAPTCDVVMMAPVEILCASQGTFGGSTEDIGNLEDIFGN